MGEICERAGHRKQKKRLGGNFKFSGCGNRVFRANCEYHVENVIIGNILHLCLSSLFTLTVRILNVIVTFIQQFATTDYVTYLLFCHNWI